MLIFLFVLLKDSKILFSEIFFLENHLMKIGNYLSVFLLASFSTSLIAKVTYNSNCFKIIAVKPKIALFGNILV